MMHPSNRPKKMPDWETYNEKSAEDIDRLYYFYEFSLKQDSQDYLEA